MKKSTRTIKEGTAGERAAMAKAIREETAAMPANIAKARKLRNAHATRRVLQELHAMKEAQQLSLADIEQATGIARANLSRMWNDPNPNVTVNTLERLAKALKCRVRIEVDAL